MSSEPCGSSEPPPQSPSAREPDESQVTPAPPAADHEATIEDQPCPPLPEDDDDSSAPEDSRLTAPEDPADVPSADEPDEQQQAAETPESAAAFRQSEAEEARSECSSATIKETGEQAGRVACATGGTGGTAAAERTARRPAPPITRATPPQKTSAAVQPAAKTAAAKKTPMKRAPLAANSATRKATPSMMRINQQPSHLQPQFCRQESFGEGIKTGPSGSDNDSDSEISDAEHFLAKGAFLLTPSHELSLEKASAICEKMNFNAPFSLTKTATGILFKFARPEDYQATFKKGFHKVTGARFYKKIPIPCRPQKTFTVFVLEVPEEVPEEDIRHALYKFHSVVEVVRLTGTGGPQQLTVQKDSSPGSSGGATKVDKAIGSTVSGSTVELGSAGPPPLIRVTLASLDEYHALLQNGLDFYGATFFPTEAASPSGLVRLPGTRKPVGNRILDVVTASGQRVRDLLPVFDAAGFSKIPPPAMKTIKPRQ